MRKKLHEEGIADTIGSFLMQPIPELTLSNERDRRALPITLTDEYRKEIQQRMDDAERAARDTHEITIRVSRQTYRDLVEAYRFLRQINPWMKSIGQRLEKLALVIRDELDRRGVPALLPVTYLMQPVYAAHTMGVSPRRLMQYTLMPFGVFI